MQYIWHKGNKIFAGGLFTDVTYVIDTSKLPALSLKHVNLPTDTLCGSVPDAYWVTKDGKAYGTYMGGPDVPGPCTYSDGTTRIGNGFAGSPGEVVRLDQNGKTVYEAPATPKSGESDAALRQHPAALGADVRQPARHPGPRGPRRRWSPATTTSRATSSSTRWPAPSSFLRRPTVRTWDISDPDKPKLKSVSFLPDGPRVGKVAHQEEPRAVMETTVTNLPGHKGAFAQTMQGGAIYYTPDITAEQADVARGLRPDDRQQDRRTRTRTRTAAARNGGWIQTSLDDKYLYHAVIGRQPSGTDKGSPVVHPQAGHPQAARVGHATRRAPSTRSRRPSTVAPRPTARRSSTSSPAPGGPHWGALDNFKLGSDGYYHETTEREAARVLELLRRPHRSQR